MSQPLPLLLKAPSLWCPCPLCWDWNRALQNPLIQAPAGAWPETGDPGQVPGPCRGPEEGGSEKQTVPVPPQRPEAADVRG